MELKVDWTIGYDNKCIFFIDKNTLIYISGQYVCFQSEDSEKIYMALPSYAVSELVVHPSENIFALAETEKRNPFVFIYSYPSLENIGIIKEFAKLDIIKLSFSNSDYLAILTGVPDFTLSIWNFKTQKQLCDRSLDFQNIDDMSVSPISWKNIVIINGDRIYLYSIEHCGSMYFINDRYIKLPPIYTNAGSSSNAVVIDSRITVAKSSSRLIAYEFDLPPSAKAGVSCEHFKEFLESQDNETRCKCVSHVWNGAGDLYFGCQDGQLIKLDTDSMIFKMIFNPVKNTSGLLRIGTPTSRLDDMDLSSNINKMCYSKEFLFLGGSDGKIRTAKVIDNEVTDSIEEILKIKGSVSKLLFNYSHTQLAVISDNGVIDIVYFNEYADHPKYHLNLGFGVFVGIGILPDGKHIATLRRNGRLQIWNSENQSEVCSLFLSEFVSSMDVSPLWNIIAIGSDNGMVNIIDTNDATHPRIVHNVKLHNSPVSKIQFGKKGQVIVTGSDDAYVAVLSGLVSENFQVLGITTFEGSLVDLCVFQNPTADEIAQIAVSSRTLPDSVGANKVCYFEISPGIMNDPSSFYENVNGTFEEEAIKKMILTFETPTFGCVLGIQPSDEKSPVLYAVDSDSRCLCKYQIPSMPPKKNEDSTKEAMLKVIQTNRVHIPGITKSTTIEFSALLPGELTQSDFDFDMRSHRTSVNMEISRKDSSRSPRHNSISRLSIIENIDWKGLSKLKTKLKSQLSTLPEKMQHQLNIICLLEELYKAGNKASRLSPIKVYKDIIHEDPNVCLTSSINNRMIMSCGVEGTIRIMDLKDEKNWAQVAAHQMKCGGTRESVFNFDSCAVLSCSNDGTIAYHKILIPNSVKLSNEQDYINMRARSESKIIQQNALLKSLPISNQGFLKEEGKESSVFLPPRTSTGLSVLSEENEIKTWSETKVFDHQFAEDQQYRELKSTIKEGIRSIRSTIQKMLDENDALSSLEKIDRQEFELDVDMKKRIQAEIETEIKKVIDEIENGNLAKQFTLDVIKKECWDQMSVKGRSLCAFCSNMEVTNFPMKDRPQIVLDQINMVVKRRMIEIEDGNDRKNYCEHLQKNALKRPKDTLETKTTFDTKTTYANSEDIEEVEDDENRDATNLTTNDLKDYEKFDKIAPNIKYLYPQMDLETRDQKIYQIILIKDIIYQLKVQFNKEFTDVYQKKEQEISRIKEKNSRIVKILNDIDMQHLIQRDPELSSSEKPEKLLVVEDSEIKVERYLTDEQKRKLEEERLADEERKRREKLDNWRERGLEDMMGGVLEVKREDELKKDIPKPLFVIAGKPQDEWTDEEKKIYEEYEKRVKELNDEREKYKKQLEAEYKKLSGIIDDAKNAFDEMLLNLFNRQISVQMSINQEEVKILRLQWSLLVDEELNGRKKEIFELKNSNQLEVRMIKNILTNAKNIIDQNQEAYDTLVAEEKIMDKAFRREFLDVHGSMFDHILKLYKRRPRNRLLGTQTIPPTQMPNYSKNNPYLGRPASIKQKQFQLETLKIAIQDLDKQDSTDTVDPALYERLCKSRRKRILKEFDIKQMALELADMQGFYQKKMEEEKSLENNELHLDNLLDTLDNYRYQYHVNKEIQLVVKQGQVEVEAIPGFIHDFTESVFLHRSTIEDLNKEIKELGRNKVKHMTKAKDSKKKFIHLEWELRRMLMEYEDLVKKMREIQCFKITKEIQRYLATEDYDSLINAEILKMEQTINHMKLNQTKNIDQKKTRLRYINDSKLIKIKTENSDLGVQLTELNVQVNERKHINKGFPSDSVGQRNVELRYQKILQRQHLVDLAKSQAREVAVLRSEVERLRMRTFPALIQHKG